MSDIIHLISEQAEPGPGSKLPDPTDWVLGERIHDSGVLHAYQAEAGLVWVLADLSQREAMVNRNTALARLRHPQIQQVAGIGLLGSRPYRADPSFDGIPLDVICREQGPFTVERSLDIALQLAEILVELHGRGLVHGHVHPGAMRLSEEQISLGDLPPLLCLDLPYAAPEVQLGAEADPRSDLFGLGYVTLCLLRGSRPDGEGRDKTWRTGKPGAIAPLPPAADLPHEIAQLLLSMVDRDPERRPRSALEVSQALARARAPSRKPPSFKVVGIALGGVLLFAGLNVAYEYFASPKAPVTPEQVIQEPVSTLPPPALPAAAVPENGPEEEEPVTSTAEEVPDLSALDRSGRTQAITRAQIKPTLTAPSEVQTEAASPLAADSPAGSPEMDPEPETSPPEETVQAPPEPETSSGPSAPNLSHFSGNYNGTANGRPLRLELSVDAEGNARGVAQQSLGAQQLRIPLRGTFSEDGRFTLIETEGSRPNTWSGTQEGDALNGQLSSGGRSRGQWSASR
ncbi:MAG: hypothetical protein ACI9VR_002004 [Cognaticolwellia sp.]|jgi:hypothetical protein